MLDLVAEVSSRLTQHRGTYFSQLRCGEETIINKQLRPHEYIGDHLVPSYECLPTSLGFSLLFATRHVDKQSDQSKLIDLIDL